MTLIEKPMMFEMGNVLATIYTKLYKEFNDRAAADTKEPCPGGGGEKVEGPLTTRVLKKAVSQLAEERYINRFTARRLLERINEVTG